MKAVIPAAGYASRLRPLTEHCHKAMLPLAGTTMMRLILHALRNQEIDEVVMVTGYRAEELEAHVREHADGLRVVFIRNPRYETTNNAYSLSLAAPWVAGEPFLLLDCDLVFEPEVLRRVVVSPHPNALAIQRRGDLGEEEMKVYSRDGLTVSQLSKQGDPHEALGESIGIEKFSGTFSRRLFEVLSRRISEGPGLTEFYEAAFQVLVDGGEPLYLVDVSDCRVLEVDFPEDLTRAEREILPYLPVGGERSAS